MGMRLIVPSMVIDSGDVQILYNYTPPDTGGKWEREDVEITFRRLNMGPLKINGIEARNLMNHLIYALKGVERNG